MKLTPPSGKTFNLSLAFAATSLVILPFSPVLGYVILSVAFANLFAGNVFKGY
jgi:hypothetical protein